MPTCQPASATKRSNLLGRPLSPLGQRSSSPAVGGSGSAALVALLGTMTTHFAIGQAGVRRPPRAARPLAVLRRFRVSMCRAEG